MVRPPRPPRERGSGSLDEPSADDPTTARTATTSGTEAPPTGEVRDGGPTDGVVGPEARGSSGAAGLPSDPEPPERRRLDRRTLIGGGLTVAVLGGLAAWLLTRSDVDGEPGAGEDAASADVVDRPTGSAPGSRGAGGLPSARSEPTLVPFDLLDQPVVGADPRRLPRDATPRWRRPLAFSQNAQWTIGIVDRRFVVAISSPRLEPVGPSAIEVLDAVTGSPVWGAPSEGPAALHEVVGEIGGRLVIRTPTDAESLVAFDVDDGSVAWRRTAADVDSNAVGALGRYELLAGTPFLARRPLDEADPTVVVDPVTGTEAGRLDGVVIGTDRRGTWFLVRDGRVVAHDLADGWTPERAVGGTMSTDPAAKTVVVGDSVLTVLESGLGEFDPGMVQLGIVRPDTLLLVDPGDPRRLGLDARIDVLTPLAGDRVAILSGGRTTAAQLDGTTLTPAWIGDGLVLAAAETVVGTFLVVSRAGGARNEIVDARTGDTVDSLTMTPGVFDSLVLTGNGFVSRKSSPEGPRLAAIGLDGEEMWALPGATPVVVGDGVVARVESDDDGTAMLVVVGSGSTGTGGGGVTQT